MASSFALHLGISAVLRRATPLATAVNLQGSIIAASHTQHLLGDGGIISGTRIRYHSRGKEEVQTESSTTAAAAAAAAAAEAATATTTTAAATATLAAKLGASGEENEVGKTSTLSMPSSSNPSSLANGSGSASGMGSGGGAGGSVLPLTAPPASASVAAASTLVSPSHLRDAQAEITAFAASRPRHGHASFVSSVLTRLDDTNTRADMSTYNALLDVFPERNSFKTASLMDAIFPKDTPQTDVAMDILDRMEEAQIIPTTETYELLLRKFGKASQPVRKVRRMAYWMRRYAHANPFALPSSLLEDVEAAETAASIIGRDRAGEAAVSATVSEAEIESSAHAHARAAATAVMAPFALQRLARSSSNRNRSSSSSGFGCSNIDTGSAKATSGGTATSSSTTPAGHHHYDFSPYAPVGAEAEASGTTEAGVVEPPPLVVRAICTESQREILTKACEQGDGLCASGPHYVWLGARRQAYYELTVGAAGEIENGRGERGESREEEEAEEAEEGTEVLAGLCIGAGPSSKVIAAWLAGLEEEVCSSLTNANVVIEILPEEELPDVPAATAVLTAGSSNHDQNLICD